MNNENIIELPNDGIITVEWASSMLQKAEMFSSYDLTTNKARVFFMLKTHLPQTEYEAAAGELEYSLSTIEVYLQFLGKLPVLDAIRDKYFTALSLSASELIPEDIDDALALMDVCIARVGKPTAKNITKALEILGRAPKPLNTATLSVEKMKHQAMLDYLLDEHQLSPDDVLQASSIDSSGKNAYLEKSLQAFSLIPSWEEFHSVIKDSVMESESPSLLRFLSDMQDASVSIESYLAEEKSYNDLVALKEVFNSEVYPKLSFEASKDK